MTLHAARVVGLHGLKHRWVEATLASGLVRDSAAWFMPPPMTERAELHRTVAAALHLALSPQTRDALAPSGGSPRYADFFRARPALLPAIVVFADVRSGWEAAHRYFWWGPPSPGPTAPYTKVARAGRVVLFHQGTEAEVIAVDLPMVDRAERAAGRGVDRDDAARPLLERVPEEAAARPTARGEPAETKLAIVCCLLALELLPAIQVRVAQVPT